MSVLISARAIHSQNAPSHHPTSKKYSVRPRKLGPWRYASSATTSGIGPADVGGRTMVELVMDGRGPVDHAERAARR
jgi:hypothetical protein